MLKWHVGSFGRLGSGSNCPSLGELSHLVVLFTRQSRSSVDGRSNLPCTHRPIAKRAGQVLGVCRRDGRSLERFCLGGNTPAIEARERGTPVCYRFYHRSQSDHRGGVERSWIGIECPLVSHAHRRKI